MFKEFMEYFVENSFSGARLRIHREIPTSEPKAVVHITHGMAEHAKRYAWFMQVLKEAGYAVYAHDIRGHGYTYAKNSSKGHFSDKNGLDQLLHDLDFVIDLIKQNHPNSFDRTLRIPPNPIESLYLYPLIKPFELEKHHLQ